MALKDLDIQNLKPPEKPKKLYDGGGLFRYLAPSGLKSWRHEYVYQGRRSTLTFGTYPDLSLYANLTSFGLKWIQKRRIRSGEARRMAGGHPLRGVTRSQALRRTPGIRSQRCRQQRLHGPLWRRRGSKEDLLQPLD
jgi:hypothetical protein